MLAEPLKLRVVVLVAVRVVIEAGRAAIFFLICCWRADVFQMALDDCRRLPRRIKSGKSVLVNHLEKGVTCMPLLTQSRVFMCAMYLFTLENWVK